MITVHLAGVNHICVSQGLQAVRSPLKGVKRMDGGSSLFVVVADVVVLALIQF